MEAESRGPPLAGVGRAASGSGDENRPSVCSRASRRAQTPPDRADPRHPASRISMPPSCGDANQAISRAKIRDTGGADTGGAEDGGTDTGSADAGASETTARVVQPAVETAATAQPAMGAVRAAMIFPRKFPPRLTKPLRRRRETHRRRRRRRRRCLHLRCPGCATGRPRSRPMETTLFCRSQSRAQSGRRRGLRL